MIDLSRDGYTHEQMLNLYCRAARGASGTLRYELRALRDKTYLKQLHALSMDIVCDSSADIKYTAIFEIVGDEGVQWNTDRLQPYAILKCAEGEFAFPLCPPLRVATREVELNHNSVKMRLECYDESSFLRNNSLADSLYYPAGTLYLTILEELFDLAGFTDHILVPTDKTIVVDREFEQGTDILTLANTLLEEINYYSLYPGIEGYLTATPYVLPEEATPDIAYSGSRADMVRLPIEIVYDTFDKANRFIGYFSNPDADVQYREVIANESPTSPVSSTNIGYTITSSPKSYENVPDAQTLYDLVYREMTETSLNYKHVTFPTPVIPIHQVNDIVALSNDLIDGIFQETTWSITVGEGTASMSHTGRSLYSE